MQICIIDLNLIFLLSFCFVFLTHNILPFLLHFFMTSSVTFYCEQIFFVIKNMMKTPYLIIWHDGEKYFLKMHCHLLICTYVFTRFFLNFHYTYWGISFWFVNCKYLKCYTVKTQTLSESILPCMSIWSMAVRVLEFSNGGYKIRKVFT